MASDRESREWFEELAGDFGLPDTNEAYLLYYQMIVTCKRLAMHAMRSPTVTQDLGLPGSIERILGAKLGMDPDDRRLRALEDKLDATRKLIGYEHIPHSG